ncbi:hypothetical protein NP233_g12019 [Leucocoprinus birnbaumii]|uniref:Uncharacterized protein n=1 Tax=Leucocoprinus birnbaumii TaxID=56174 RepID=A0AAD5VH29_9AGAR|nr:hypothetical protein NP233_g12019 [Leucocoprinus birnbaumii]
MDETDDPAASTAAVHGSPPPSTDFISTQVNSIPSAPFTSTGHIRITAIQPPIHAFSQADATSAPSSCPTSQGRNTSATAHTDDVHPTIYVGPMGQMIIDLTVGSESDLDEIESDSEPIVIMSDF